MSEAFVERLVEFAESGNQQKIISQGQSYQGWVMEISDEAILISTGYADKSGKDLWLSFEQLQQAELSYYDTQSMQWQVFKL